MTPMIDVLEPPSTSGLIREAPDAEAAPFDEVWHLVKPLDDDSHPWAIAGIQQAQ